MNHEDIVRRVAEQFPPDNTSTDTLLVFVLRVLAALPANEKAGLLRKDGGENIARYEPAGVNVSISRICYPDGSIYKILSDAGPGGTNGPSWADNGTVDPKLYTPVGKSGTGPAPPPQTPRGVGYDESEVVAFAKDCDQFLRPDSGRVGVNCARMQFDAFSMGYTASRAKHLAELKQELGR